MGAFDGGNFHVVLVHKCSAHSLKCFMLNRVGNDEAIYDSELLVVFSSV